MRYATNYDVHRAEAFLHVLGKGLLFIPFTKTPRGMLQVTSNWQGTI